MRIYPIRISDRKTRPAGILLIELVVVIGILAILLMLVTANFQNLLQTSLERETGRLAGVIRMLRNEAVLKNTRFRLMMDLRAPSYFVEQKMENGEFSTLAEPPVLRSHQLPEEIKVTDMVVLGKLIRPDRDIKPVPIIIDSSGYIDPFMLHFTFQRDEFTFKVSGFTGKVELLEGYVKP